MVMRASFAACQFAVKVSQVDIAVTNYIHIVSESKENCYSKINEIYKKKVKNTCKACTYDI